MFDDPNLKSFRQDIETGKLPWAADLKIASVEFEEIFDAEGEVGVQVWILLREEPAPGVLNPEWMRQVERELATRAGAAGFRGPMHVAPADPDEADLMPSRRSEAAA